MATAFDAFGQKASMTCWLNASGLKCRFARLAPRSPVPYPARSHVAHCLIRTVFKICYIWP
jgi:hypothetical protein